MVKSGSLTHPKTFQKDGDSSVIQRSIVCFDDQGKRYKSSREVIEALKERGYLGRQTEIEMETYTGSEYKPSPTKRLRPANEPRCATIRNVTR